MPILSSHAPVRLAVLVVIAVMIAGSDRVAGDAQSIPATTSCEWRGTAPFCKGRCEPGESSPQATDKAEIARYQGFGASCISGVKAYCCKVYCPGGWVLSGNECVELQDKGVPVGTQIITLPQGPVQRKKGPIEAPTPIEGTGLEKGPITTSEPAPSSTPPAPTPEPRPVKVLLPVDVYDKPSQEGGIKIGELAKDTQGGVSRRAASGGQLV